MAHVDDLLTKIKTLSETIWERRAIQPEIDEWLLNFDAGTNGTANERRYHALYLLSHFMFFGARQMRELLRVVFRDLYRHPIIQEIRRLHGDTTDRELIEREFRAALQKTLFLGVGNPSESGCHLLYYFRQENGLPKTRFIHSHELFYRRRLTKWQAIWAVVPVVLGRRDHYAGIVSLRHPDVHRYVFIDDFCGSGQQGTLYSRDIVEDLKALNPTVHVSYFVLFATATGIQRLRRNTAFDVVECIFELDESFQCFSPSSRYFPAPATLPGITSQFAEEMCRSYGDHLFHVGPLGFENCQLLLGFQHNTPDNTLPIFWADGDGATPWNPLFRRYPKLYG